MIFFFLGVWPEICFGQLVSNQYLKFLSLYRMSSNRTKNFINEIIMQMKENTNKKILVCACKDTCLFQYLLL